MARPSTKSRRSPEPAVPGCRGRWPWRPGIGLPPTGRTLNLGEQKRHHPRGAAARSADTPAESHNRHAPTWHFAGIRPRRITKHTQRQRATSNASSMSSSSTCTDRSTSRIPSATLMIPSVPTASVPAPIIVGAIPTTRRSTSVSVPAARSRAGAAGRSTPRGLGGTTLQRRGGRSGAGRPSSRCPRRRVRHRTPPAARAPVQHRFGCCGGRLTQPIFTRKCAQMCSRDADQHRSQSTKTAVELHI